MSSRLRVSLALVALWTMASSPVTVRADKSESSQLILFEVTGAPEAVDKFKKYYVELTGEFDQIHQLQHPVRQSPRITVRNQVAGFPVAHRIVEARAVGGERGSAAGRSLDVGDPPPLLGRRKQVRPRGAEEPDFLGFTHKSQKPHAAFDSAFLHLPANVSSPVPTVTDNPEFVADVA